VARVRVRLLGTGTFEDPFRVSLPTYVLDVIRDEEGNPIYDEEGYTSPAIDYTKRVAYVLLPDDEVDEEGRLDEKLIRKKYGGRWSTFRREEVEAPKE